MELVCCERLWGAGAAQRGVLCLSLALGTPWDGAEHPLGAAFLLCLPAPSACSAMGLLGQLVVGLELGLAEGTEGLPLALGRVRCR